MANQKRQRSPQDYFVCDANIRQIRGGNSTLARGAFGEISVVMDVTTDRMLVAKTIGQPMSGGFGVPKKQLSKEVCNEVMALRILTGHPNIVSFRGLSTSPDQMMPSGLCLVFEYSPIDLHSVEGPLTFDMIRFIAKEILQGLHHCHSNAIIHRDVSPKNFLVTTKGRVQLCDFGLAKPCPHLLEAGEPEPTKDDAKGLCTLYYRAPELLLGGPAVQPSVDMYSCGLVVAELVIGRPLLAGKNVLDQIHRTFQLLGTPSSTDGWVGKLSDFSKLTFHNYDGQPLENSMPRATECPHLMDLLRSLIVLDPDQRISAAAALESIFVASSPIAPSAIDLIPTECKSVAFSASSSNLAEQEALALASSRRTWSSKRGVSHEDCTLREVLLDQ